MNGKPALARVARMLAVATTLAAACTRPDPIVPPGELARAIRAEAHEELVEPGPPRPEVHLVNATFAEALEGYSLELRSHLVSPGTNLGPESGRLLLLLARSVETLPNSDTVDVGSAAARIRDHTSRLAVRGAEAPSKAQVVMAGVEVAADVFLALARGPYAGSTQVRARAEELARLVGEVRALPRGPRDVNAVEALRGAELVLKAIHEAAGSRP